MQRGQSHEAGARHAACGTVRGSFAITGTGGNADEIKLDGERLDVRSGQGNSYKLRRVNPDRLEGDYLTGTGRSYPGGIWLQRVP